MSEAMKWGQLVVLLLFGGGVGWVIMTTYSRELSRPHILVRLFMLNLFVVAAGLAAGSFFASFFPVIFAIIAVGMITFFGFLLHAIRAAPNARLEDRDLRIAITASITTMYLTLVGYGVFVVGTPGGAADPIAQSLMTSFASVVGVVIAFYFGTAAYLEGKGLGPPPQGSDKPASSP